MFQHPATGVPPFYGTPSTATVEVPNCCFSPGACGKFQLHRWFLIGCLDDVLRRRATAKANHVAACFCWPSVMTGHVRIYIYICIFICMYVIIYIYIDVYHFSGHLHINIIIFAYVYIEKLRLPPYKYHQVIPSPWNGLGERFQYGSHVMRKKNTTPLVLLQKSTNCTSFLADFPECLPSARGQPLLKSLLLNLGLEMSGG